MSRPKFDTAWLKTGSRVCVLCTMMIIGLYLYVEHLFKFQIFFFFFAGNFSGACGVYCFLPSIKRLFYKGLLFCGVGGVDPLLSFPKVFLYLLYKIKISFF